MSRYDNESQHFTLFAIKSSDHSQILPTLDATDGWVVVIPASGTFLFPFGNDRARGTTEACMQALSAWWNAALAGTITIEVTNFPRTQTGADSGPADVTDDDLTDRWQKLDITAAGPVYSVASGTGNSITKFTATVGGTNAGGAAWNVPEVGWRRYRAKLIASAGGHLRLSLNSKLGS